jgi:hypothetical protein
MVSHVFTISTTNQHRIQPLRPPRASSKVTLSADTRCKDDRWCGSIGMQLTYPNSTGSGYAVSSNTRNEGMRSVRPLGIQGREDDVREQG